ITGVFNGNITAIYLRPNSAAAGPVVTNCTIKMGQTSATSYASATDAFITGLTTVYSNPSLTVTNPGTANWVKFTLQTPFYYDPTLPLVVEFSSTAVSIGFPVNVFLTPTIKTQLGTPNTATNGNGAIAGSNYHMHFGVDMVAGSNVLLPPIANFYTPDTVWINSPQTLLNTSSFQSRVFWNLPDENPLYPGYNRTTSGVYAGYIDTAKYKNHFTYTFTSPGLKRVKLLAVNDAKRDSLLDSIVKYIYVDTPSQKPKADFISFKRKLGFSEEAPLIDLSTNGPNQWEWSFDPPCATCATDPNAFPNYFN
ncbi:MAG: hypothetical protein V4643_04020, partial [Bacteroidota bacterium]